MVFSWAEYGAMVFRSPAYGATVCSCGPTAMTPLIAAWLAAIAYLNAHASAVQTAATQTVGQWKTWYWICFGGIVFFLLSIPLLRGRWRPKDAKRDEEAHEAQVQEELAKLNA